MDISKISGDQQGSRSLHHKNQTVGVAPPPSLWNIGILHYKQAKLRRDIQHSVCIKGLIEGSNASILWAPDKFFHETLTQSICTHYSCFENMGRFVTLKKIKSKIWT